MPLDPTSALLNRRQALGRLAATTAGITLATRDAFAAPEEPPPRTGMGLVIYDYNIRRRWMRERNAKLDLFEPLTFLKHCATLGAGGMQARLGVLSAPDIRTLRDYASTEDLYIEAIVSPPKDDADVDRFTAEIKTARETGALAVRATIIPGRRYERFKTLEEFRTFEARGRAMLERATPVVERHRIPLAIENHKDQRIDERLALFEHIDSEFVGACVDTGNSFALMDGAYEPIAALAPYAFSVHLKDQALRPYDDGFLLGDIPLGQGSFDLKRMVQTIRKARPQVRFSLELITRDPLKVPCLTDQFWATLPDVPASDLARTLRFVREHPADALQQVSPLPIAEQVALEDANVAASLKYAREELSL